MRNYIAIIHKEPESDYGRILPRSSRLHHLGGCRGRGNIAKKPLVRTNRDC